jgi:hypothetical protein
MHMERSKGIVPHGRIMYSLAAALVAGLFALATPTPAKAYPYGCCWHHGWGWGWGWGFGVPWPYYPAYAPYYPPYYYPPPAPVMVQAPAVQAQPSCKAGTWRYQDGKTVAGTACLQSDGTWRLSQ